MTEVGDRRGPPAAGKPRVCAVHPKRPALLSCARCGDPMCADCRIPTPVGFKCSRCAGMPTARGDDARRRSRTGTAPPVSKRRRPSRRAVTLTIAVAVLLVSLVVWRATSGGSAGSTSGFAKPSGG
ncbi:MAG: B-box zinc finger protein, partial [Acidimicrobiales bacterium]